MKDVMQIVMEKNESVSIDETKLIAPFRVFGFSKF